MADGATGNLESASGRDIMRKLAALNEEGTSIILITHDNKLAQMAKRIVTIQDGRIVSDRASEGVRMLTGLRPFAWLSNPYSTTRSARC